MTTPPRPPSAPLTTSLVYKTDKKTAVHSRIIWACAWTSCGRWVGEVGETGAGASPRYFGTASRDKKVVMWGEREDKTWGPVGPALTLEDSVTALAMAPTPAGHLLACGLDSGGLALVSWSPGQGWGEVLARPLHMGTVTRLAFRPEGQEHKKEDLLLASCGADWAVRISSVSSA